MLTFTHTYLLHLAYKQSHGATIPEEQGALILGNVIPDFVTHLGRTRFQAVAHNLTLFDSTHRLTALLWGAIFHILCDNYSTLGKITFEGNYHQCPKNGFIELLAQQVVMTIPLKIPRRRILQCAFDIFVIRQDKQLLIHMLKIAESYLQNNFHEINHRIAELYGIEPNQLSVGLQRFAQIYGSDFIEFAAQEEYRLYPLARSLLNLDTLTGPQVILKSIQHHPELMELVELNMGLISDNWQELLEETVHAVTKYPGISEALN